MCEQMVDECVGKMTAIRLRSVRLAAISRGRQVQNRNRRRIEHFVVVDWIFPVFLRQ